MNKKFSTLLASFLLAGGLLSPVMAEKFAPTIDEGQYFQVQLDDRATFTANYMLLNSDGSYIYPSQVKDFDATLWRVEIVKKKVNGVDQILGYKLINKVTGNALSAKKGDKVYDTFDSVQMNCLWFKSGSIGYVNGEVSEGGTGGTDAWWFDLVKVEPQKQTADQLNEWNEGSFDLDICYQPLKSNGVIDDKDPVSYDAKGNVFAVTLKAEDEDNDGLVELYQVDSKKRIVLLKDKWGNITNSLKEAGYKFAALNEKEYAAAKNILADEFTITKPATVKGEPLEVVAVNGTDKYELVVSGVDGTYYVTTSTDTNAGVADYTADGSTNADNTYVKFGKGNSVDNDIFIGKLWEIYKNDKIASPDCEANFVAPSQVATGYPEGQWLWNDEAEVFVNRESGKTLSYPGLRLTEKEGVYSNGKDTWTIKEVGTPGESVEGYLHGYTNDQLKQKAFFIGAPVDATKDTIYLSKNAAGVLKFTADKGEAVEFRLTPNALDNKHQTVQIRNTYTAWKDKANGVKEQKTDVVSFTQYVITEAVSGKALYYDAKEERYVLATKKEAEDKDNLTAAPEFLIKNKKADTYNIVFFDGEEIFGKEKDDKYHFVNDGSFCNSAEKLLSAFNVSELVKTKEVYALVQNDLFIIKDADALQYRADFSDNGVLDTIKIFRNDDPSYVLYEQGKLLEVKDEVLEGFLGMENIYDPKFAKMRPAMLADTAFHANTYRPQYMLAVDAKIVPAGKYCPICGKDDCAHAEATRGFVEGRYLVNLVDSAKACENTLKNKFTYEMYEEDAPYYRLGFVQAKHIGDTLVIASTHDTIDLAANRPDYDKVCTFAFRYVDAKRDAFTIETVYNYGFDNDGDFDADQYKRGYIKYHNGIPVVTPKSSEAWVFDLEELTGEENAPTANESIATSEVTIIAGEGNVTIAGAAGKKVVISNILGQVVANTVLASDNAVIAAPQGVVVVAVEGEEAVKAIVK